MKTFLTLDLGGTNCRFALVDERGGIIKKETHPTPPPREFYKLLQEFSESLSVKPVAAGFALAGPVDPATGILNSPVNMQGWAIEPIGKNASELLGIPVFCGNDASLACFGEAKLGAGLGVENLVLLTLGTGIGGGAIVNGQLHLGTQGQALEVGHMQIFNQGRQCGCGLNGHLEAYVSGTALGQIATERFGKATTSKELFESSDKVSKEIIADAATNLGFGLANLVHLFNPKLILFSGSLAEHWEVFVLPAGRAMEDQLMPAFKGVVQIQPAKLAGDAGLLGAMAWAKAGFELQK
ncbi:MAG: ROK family protein [SAR324 cluster bacterium]|nr:ROK family protein [SAR324 cluster bacterium]